MVENKRQFDYDIDAELQRYKELVEKVDPYVIDIIPYIHNQIKAGKRILLEGANALMLDIDFGTYPCVTSSSTAIGGVCTGLGAPPPQNIKKAVGVVKAYTNRVDGGPFTTEQLNETGKFLQHEGFEFGVTTGRKRRCGWLDLVVVNYSNMINGHTSFKPTKLDKSPVIKVAVAYKLDGKKI